jgi:hypothetical protein
MFNLREGVDAKRYEQWAQRVDVPTVRELPGVAGFSVHRSTGLLVGDGDPPYAYTEILDIDDMEAFSAALGSETMQRIAGEFQAMADNPVFVTTEDL